MRLSSTARTWNWDSVAMVMMPNFFFFFFKAKWRRKMDEEREVGWLAGVALIFVFSFFLELSFLYNGNSWGERDGNTKPHQNPTPWKARSDQISSKFLQKITHFWIGEQASNQDPTFFPFSLSLSTLFNLESRVLFYYGDYGRMTRGWLNDWGDWPMNAMYGLIKVLQVAPPKNMTLVELLQIFVLHRMHFPSQYLSAFGLCICTKLRQNIQRAWRETT